MIQRIGRALRADPGLGAILALSLGLNLVGITWGLPNVEPWIADSVAGELTLKVWATYTVSSHKYPYLQSLIAFLAYSPFLIWWLLTGKLDGGCWPYLKARCFEGDAFAQMGTLILVSRLLSALMGVGTVWVTWRLALAAGASRRAARLAALATALSYVAVLYAHLGTLDGPLAFWYSLSLLAFLAILQHGRPRDYAAFGLASGAALGTKEGIIGAYVLTAAAILWSHGLGLRSDAGDTGSGRARSAARLRISGILDRRLLALLAGLMLVYGLATNPIFNPAGFIEHWRQWMPSDSRMQDYQASRTLMQSVLRAARQLVTAMDLPLLLLALAGLVLSSLDALRAQAATARRSLSLLIPSLSYLVFSIFLSRIVEMRVLLPLVPVLAVFAGQAADRLLASPRSWRGIGLALLVAIYAHAGLHALNHDLLLLRDSRYTAEAWLRSEAGPETRILAFGDSRYLPRLEWLGLEPSFDDADRPPGPQLEALEPEIVIVSSRSYDRFEGQPEAEFYTALLAGQLGYRTALDVAPELPFRPGMDPGRASDSVAPRITILRRSQD